MTPAVTLSAQIWPPSGVVSGIHRSYSQCNNHCPEEAKRKWKKKKSLNHLQSNQAPRSTWPSTPESTYMYTNGKFKISFLSLKLSLLAASPLVNTPPYCPSVVNLPATLANPWAEISQGNSLTQMLPKELHKRLNLYLTRQNSSLGKQTYFRSSLLSTWWGSGDWLE